ncbi:MAG: gluconate 2-dehydrogenase subunit 3 family protein [Niabella sp.]
MNRRKAVQRVALLLGGSVLGAELFMQTGCKSGTTEKNAATTLASFFTKDEIAFLDEVAETIIPRTDTPGAKDAMVGEFMNVMVRDCYTPEDQKIFKEGIGKLEQQCQEKYNAGFMKIQPGQRTELLTAIDKEQKEYQANKNKGDEKHYFRMMRELTLLGYFTSEQGATKALRYVAVPGKYEPCIPYAKGEKAWAL